MLLILNYHYVRENFLENGGIKGITHSDFIKQIELISKFGDFLSLDSLKKFNSNVNLNKNYILITFDDALKEQYNFAFSYLYSKGIPAAFFVNLVNSEKNITSNVHKNHLIREKISIDELNILLFDFLKQNNLVIKQNEIHYGHYKYDDVSTAKFKYVFNFCLSKKLQDDFQNKLFHQLYDEDKISKSLYMNKDELNEIASNNCLDSHLYEHVSLKNISDLEFEQQLTRNKTLLNQLYGVKSEVLSFPYGDKKSVTESLINILKKNNYKYSISMNRDFNYNLKNNYLLNRFSNSDLPGGNFSIFDNNFKRIIK